TQVRDRTTRLGSSLPPKVPPSEVAAATLSSFLPSPGAGGGYSKVHWFRRRYPIAQAVAEQPLFRVRPSPAPDGAEPVVHPWPGKLRGAARRDSCRCGNRIASQPSRSSHWSTTASRGVR